MAFIVGILQIDLDIPLCNSLKEKRGILRKLENQIRKKFNVSVAEIDLQDFWRSARLGITAGANDRDVVDRTLHNVARLIECDHNVDVRDMDVEIL